MEPAAVEHSAEGRIGRSLLLRLEMMVAADIVKTIVLEAALRSLGILAWPVVVRAFVSWSPVLEIDCRGLGRRDAFMHEGSNHDRQV